VGFLGRVALVEEVMFEGGMLFAEGVGEVLCLEGLRADCAVGVEWIADDEDFDFVLTDEARDGFEVGSLVGAMEGEERNGEDAEFVGDGQADTAVADVERESAGGRHGCSRKAANRGWQMGARDGGSANSG